MDGVKKTVGWAVAGTILIAAFFGAQAAADIWSAVFDSMVTFREGLRT